MEIGECGGKNKVENQEIVSVFDTTTVYMLCTLCVSVVVAVVCYTLLTKAILWQSNPFRNGASKQWK